MSLSNYPPGVTGNEPEIAGRDESEEERYCVVCEGEQPGTTLHMRGVVYEWTCDGCGVGTEEYEDEPDEDERRDR